MSESKSLFNGCQEMAHIWAKIQAFFFKKISVFVMGYTHKDWGRWAGWVVWGQWVTLDSASRKWKYYLLSP